MSTSRWIKCISTQGSIRGIAIQATDLARELADMHGLKGLGARGLGEAAVAALLVSSYCKNGERINLNIRGSGHYSQALVDAYPDGKLRGYVVERTLSADERMRISEEGPWGEGLLSILKTKDQEGQQPYIGTVPLLTGHLAKDLTFYWFQSEQVPSAVGIAVEMNGDRIESAGGFLVQAMPGASPAEVKMIEQHIQDIHSLSQEFVKSADPIQVLSKIFQSTAFIVVEERPLVFHCQCSWDRVKKALILVGADELRAMLKEEEQAVVRCDFCSKDYSVDRKMLESLIEMTTGGRTDGTVGGQEGAPSGDRSDLH